MPPPKTRVQHATNIVLCRFSTMLERLAVYSPLTLASLMPIIPCCTATVTSLWNSTSASAPSPSPSSSPSPSPRTPRAAAPVWNWRPFPFRPRVPAAAATLSALVFGANVRREGMVGLPACPMSPGPPSPSPPAIRLACWGSGWGGKETGGARRGGGAVTLSMFLNFSSW